MLEERNTDQNISTKEVKMILTVQPSYSKSYFKIIETEMYRNIVKRPPILQDIDEQQNPKERKDIRSMDRLTGAESGYHPPDPYACFSTDS